MTNNIISYSLRNNNSKIILSFTHCLNLPNYSIEIFKLKFLEDFLKLEGDFFKLIEF